MVSRWVGGGQTQVPAGEAMVPLGQQILVGPVGVVPDGQTQLRVV